MIANYVRLHQEYRYIHLLNHRNKNQHRVAIWWKWFSLMKRNVASVVEVLQRASRAKKGPTSRDMRILYRLLHNFFNMESKLYYSFNGVIQLGQFLSLGVVLVGLLARVHSIYEELVDKFREQFIVLGCFHVPKYDRKLEGTSESTSLEEVGELIEEDELPKMADTPTDIMLPVPTKPEKEMKETKKKKKKKKKKTSVIDDLFG